MASELKPWRYEIKYGPEGEDAYSWVYDDHGAMVATMKTHKAKQIVDAMNTRTAPAATDTGLVTIGRKERSPHGVHFSVDLSEGTELVLRSQAEELLAAERAKKEMLAETIDKLHGIITKLEADNAAKDADIAELVHDLNRIKDHETELVNDNAAQAARIKELEEEVEWAQNAVLARQRHAEARCEALEAKLAAAELALEFYADASKWNDGYFKSEDDGTVLRAYPSSIEKDQGDKARAVLGGKPS